MLYELEELGGVAHEGFNIDLLKVLIRLWRFWGTQIFMMIMIIYDLSGKILVIIKICVAVFWLQWSL